MRKSRKIGAFILFCLGFNLLVMSATPSCRADVFLSTWLKEVGLAPPAHLDPTTQEQWYRQVAMIAVLENTIQNQERIAASLDTSAEIGYELQQKSQELRAFIIELNQRFARELRLNHREFFLLGRAIESSQRILEEKLSPLNEDAFQGNGCRLNVLSETINEFKRESSLQQKEQESRLQEDTKHFVWDIACLIAHAPIGIWRCLTSGYNLAKTCVSVR